MASPVPRLITWFKKYWKHNCTYNYSPVAGSILVGCGILTMNVSMIYRKQRNNSYKYRRHLVIFRSDDRRMAGLSAKTILD